MTADAPHLDSVLLRRPIIVALAGPNGAGKSTFYESFLSATGLHFVNADLIAAAADLDAYAAAELADALRRKLVGQRESFIFETVFSDPLGDKLAFLKDAERAGYTVLLIFVGLARPQLSDARVAIRAASGGHDVPSHKILERFPRTLNNLKAALRELSNIRVYDHSDLTRGYRLVALRDDGARILLHPPIPAWLRPLLPSR